MTNLEPIIAELRPLAIHLDPDLNDHERALEHMSGCILLGAVTRGDIARTMCQLGFKWGHIMALLDKHTGANPDRFRFGETADGQYFEHARRVT